MELKQDPDPIATDTFAGVSQGMFGCCSLRVPVVLENNGEVMHANTQGSAMAALSETDELVTCWT